MEPQTLLKSLLSSEKLKPILVPKISNLANVYFSIHFFPSFLCDYFLFLDESLVVMGAGSVAALDFKPRLFLYIFFIILSIFLK